VNNSGLSHEDAALGLNGVVAGILNARDRIDFMTVARAMVLKEHLNGKAASQRIAEQLGISRQTRHNWLKPESVTEWTTIWDARLNAAKSGEPSPKKKQERITEAE
jgi:hypothetical protein